MEDGHDTAAAVEVVSSSSSPSSTNGGRQERHGLGLRAGIVPVPRPAPTLLPIVLGSSSGYRRAVLDDLGWQFTTASPDIDEKTIRDADPRNMCAMIARAKAEALVGRLNKPAVLITADQVCLFEGDEGEEEVREKPDSVEQARAFLESYSERSVKTLTAVCVTDLQTGRRQEGTHESTVFWRKISAEVVDAVMGRGNTMGSAGGFALEDPDLRRLVERIDGSLDSVVGMPVDLVCGLIERAVQPGLA